MMVMMMFKRSMVQIQAQHLRTSNDVDVTMLQDDAIVSVSGVDDEEDDDDVDDYTMKNNITIGTNDFSDGNYG